jgi:hypothetical protein
MKQQQLVFCDTSWDSRDDLLSQWSSFSGQPQKEGRAIEFKGEGSLFQVMEQNHVEGAELWLVSRFYGWDSNRILELRRDGVKLIPTGPSEIKNSGIQNLKVSPERPFSGETVYFSGQLTGKPGDKVTVKLFLEGDEVSRQSLEFSSEGTAGFSATAQAKNLKLMHVALRLPDDEYLEDNELSLTFPVRQSFNVALIDDRHPASSRQSSLWYVKKFMDSLAQIHGDHIPFLVKEISSAQYKEDSSIKWDWAVWGEVKEIYLNEQALSHLVFPPVEPVVASRLEKLLGLHFYSFEDLFRELTVVNLSAEERTLFQKNWNVWSYRQFEVPAVKMEPLLKSGKEILCFQSGAVTFSAFFFRDSTFNGIRHPYFPLFLEKLFLNRTEGLSKALSGSSRTSFSRDEKQFSSDIISQVYSKADADVSSLFLLLCVFVLLGEVILMRKQEQFGGL